ncbi:putative phage baseplate assembly protein [Micromonospora sp. Llam0]|uniref:putative baseplate assembly protein n=1 Tax=Micromonospora sp. Llam0 TaxID=2485143 RepID=UPI000F4A70E9|nr:putative baseplate assembly protein [Micromonospora sp. Llam0]ROO61563.1 putative phage baseplate assembly protein [Micromonospora sp. Llam0]
MTGQPPPIDPRDRAALAVQTAALATRYSDWQPPADGRPDAGQALIGIFARYAELVVQRLNQVPERDYLAFLNLIGTRPVPPRPARVPLTFALAPGSRTEAVVPAGTQVAATPRDGEDDEVVFETATDLVVTPAQLQAVLVDDAPHDSYADRSAAGTGQRDESFAAFTGDQPVPHRFYLACDPVLATEGTKTVTVRLTTTDVAVLGGWPISWAYWDGARWQPVDADTVMADTALVVTLAGLPPLPAYDVNGTTAGWLRAQLDMPLPHPVTGLALDAVAAGQRTPQGDVAGVFPFGESSQVRRCYLSVPTATAFPGAVVRLTVTLARPATAVPDTRVQVVWSYKVGDEWQPLGQSSTAQVASGFSNPAGLRDGTQALTRDGDISFRMPAEWPAELFQGRSGHWLRAEIVDDGATYATLPQLAAVTVGYDWELPVITAIDVWMQTAPDPVALPHAVSNTSPIDVTKDFRPFGEQPRFNDTCYLACPANLVWPGAELVVEVTLTNGPADPADPDDPAGPAVPPVRTEGHPRLVWEAWDGTAWRTVTVDDPEYAFTDSATVTLTPPVGFAPTEVNGVEEYWVRVRLIGGDYGAAAHYTRNDDGGYELVDATFAPPVVTTLSWRSRAGLAAAVPAQACATENDFRLVTHHRDGDEPWDVTPFVPNPSREPALYLGFDQPFGNRPVTLYLQVEPPAPEEVAADRLAGADLTDRADLVWEYSGVDGWRPLAAIDETGTLGDRGVVRFVGPPDLTARERFGQHRCWLRLRHRRGSFAIPPRLRRVAPNTTWATQTTTITEEILGSGVAEAGQRLTIAQTPVLAGQQLVVREPQRPSPVEEAALVEADGSGAVTVSDDAEQIWVRWHEVTDFHRSGPGDRHYTIDAATGEIGFGDGQAGRVVPLGQNNVRITYRTGGGEQGNRPAGTVVTLKSAVPYLDSVTNHEPASGGAGWEPLDRVRARGPKALRHRDRAVTVDDFVDLAFESSAEVARAQAVPPSGFDPFNLWLDPDEQPGGEHRQADVGGIGVIVVPVSVAARPAPSLGLLRQVDQHLRARCAPTVGLWVAGPEWIEVTVTATVVATTPESAGLVRARVEQTLDRFLHPLTGGPDGTGWAFGRKPHRSDLYAAVTAVDGVDHVRELAVAQVAESEALGERLAAVLDRSLAQGAAEPVAADLTRWLARALAYSGRHQITVTLPA